MSASAASVERPESLAIPPHLIVDFDVYQSTSDAERYHQAYVDFQRGTAAPLVWSERHGGHWIATRGQDVYDLYADHERFSSRHYFVPAAPAQGSLGAFTLDPPEHGPFRAFLDAGMSAKVVSTMQPPIRRLAAELAEQTAPRGGGDFLTAFADKLALTVFLGLVDLPFSDREQLGALVEMAARDPDPDTRVGGIRRIAEYLLPHIDHRRAHPGADLLSRAVNADIGGRRISLDEAVGAAIHLMGAGLDTVSSLFGFVILFLARNPQARRTLVANPNLIHTAATELIRRFPVVVMVRQARCDMDFLGVALRQGEMVAIPTAFFNLDERIYERPLEVDWDRRVGRLLTFGNGPHRCPGMILGRSELVIGLQEWLARVPEFAVAPGATIPVAGGTVAKLLSLPLVW